jgi:UDP-glucose 4-epimerase
MQIIVFGGSGFLGSHVADVLSDRGYRVTIFDKVASPHLKGTQKMILGDILDRKGVAAAIQGMDIVYNFAAQADIEFSFISPLDTVELNVIGNMNILDACREAKVQRYIFSSSIYVYSDRGSFYRSTKQACELFIENYKEEFDLNYTILRYGSLYGPRSNDSNWVYRILKQALIDGKITREGDGEEIREYIHVQDAARLSVDILSEEYKNKCFLITGNEQVKIKDLLMMIREILKGKVNIEFIPTTRSAHYVITPYVFNPQVACKIKSNTQIDMGQGMLEILTQLHKELILSQSK